MRSIVTMLALVIPGLFLLAVADAVADPSERHQQVAAIAGGAAPMTDAQIPDLAHGAAMLSRQPVAFIENQGQWDGAFSHVATFGPMAVFLEDRGWAFTLTEYSEKARHPGDPLADRGVPESEPGRGVAVRMRFGNGADAATPVPEERLSGVHNYFLGNDPARWKSNVPLHGSVRMEHLYPGIDVRARGSDGHFEYDLLVEPGADLDRVQVEVAGADGLHLDADGTLVMETALGPVRQPVPKTWQVTATGERQEITCSYVLFDNTRFGFAAPERDRDHALVVDPGLIWSTFLGDGGNDRALALDLDTSGAVTVAGLTLSPTFPTTPGVFDTTHNGGGTSTIGGDAFVTRLDPSGGALLWSSFLGGGGGDVVYALGVDATGTVTVTGLTDSSDFPVTVGAFDTFYNGDYDAFVTRLDPSGATVLWSTFLGGGGQDYGSALAIDASGSVTVAGTASANFPTTTGAFDTTHGGGQDGFVSRLDENGSALLWSTFLGSGGTHEGVFAIGADASEAVTVTGYTNSSDYPTTPGAFDTTYNGANGFLNAIGDAFVTRLAPNGSSLLWSTFLGGAGGDMGTAVGLDPSGEVTVAGYTTSSDLPTTPGAVGTAFGGGAYDAFVTRLDTSGATLVWSTFLGSGGADHASALVLGPSGAVTVAGYTSSPNFPTTIGAFDNTHGGGYDAFVTRVAPSGDALLSSTFLGAGGWDRANALGVDAAGVVTVAGLTDSSTFPATSGAFDTTHGGGYDAFVARLLPTAAPPPCLAGACLDLTSSATIGNTVTIVLQSPSPNAICYVLADTQTANFPVGTIGSTTYYSHLALSPSLIPLADPSGTFGNSLTYPVTDANGNWSFSLSVPNDPALVGVTYHGEAFVQDLGLLPNGLFHQSNLLAVTIQ